MPWNQARHPVIFFPSRWSRRKKKKKLSTSLFQLSVSVYILLFFPFLEAHRKCCNQMVLSWFLFKKQRVRPHIKHAICSPRFRGLLRYYACGYVCIPYRLVFAHQNRITLEPKAKCPKAELAKDVQKCSHFLFDIWRNQRCQMIRITCWHIKISAPPIGWFK